MRAVILTAGAAQRLRPHTEDRPKALLPVAGVPILRRTMTSLMHVGFDEFVIGTGYRGDDVRAAVTSWFPEVDVTFVDNPDYAATHNGRSLFLLREHLDGEPFILFDDDVVFEPGVIETVLERGLDVIAVRSVGGLALDEVKVHADEEDRVVSIGADQPLRHSMGESVGIFLFSGETSRALFAALEHGGLTETYEVALQQIIDAGATIFGVDIGTLYAAGIDTYQDLCAANARLAGVGFALDDDARLAL
jgi:L-glutamine-phosphate cytidylyltransferase